MDWLVVLGMLVLSLASLWLFVFMFGNSGLIAFCALSLVLANTLVLFGAEADVLGLNIAPGALLIPPVYVAAAFLTTGEGRAAGIKFAYTLALVAFFASLLSALGLLLAGADMGKVALATLIGGMASMVGVLAGLLVLVFLFNLLKQKNLPALASLAIAGLVALVLDSLLYSFIYMVNDVTSFVEALIAMAVLLGVKLLVLALSVPLFFGLVKTPRMRFFADNK